MVFGWFHLFTFSLSLNHLLKFEFSIGNGWSIFWFEIPNSPSNFSSNSNPMRFWVESNSCNGSRSIKRWILFLNISEIINSNLLILSTCDNEITSGRNSQTINVSLVSLEAILDVESLVVPYLKISIPTNWGKEMSSNWALATNGNISNLWNPIMMIVVLNGVSALASNIPELDGSIGTRWKNISSIIWDSTRENFLLVFSSKPLGGLSGSEIPESHFFIPGGR